MPLCERVRFHPGDLEMLQRNVDDHVAGRTPRLEHEYRILLPDGAVRWIQSRGQCFRDADGRPVRMAGASIVITERKRAEEALRQSEQRYQLAIAGVNQGVWDWDLASDMVFMSARAQELLGREAGSASAAAAGMDCAVGLSSGRPRSRAPGAGGLPARRIGNVRGRVPHATRVRCVALVSRSRRGAAR